MPLQSYQDEAYTVKITVGENRDFIDAIIDTDLGYIVVETTDCADCASGKKDTSGAGMSKTANAVEGDLHTPFGKYSGVEGTATFCIYDENNGAYTNTPTTGNIAGDNMPCIENAFVHYADNVEVANANAVAYLGLAL